MKLVIFSFDVPYPPNSGGRLDIWAHATSLAAIGHSILLFSFAEGSASDSIIRPILEAGIEDVHLLPFVEARIRKEAWCVRTSLLAKKYFSPVPSCCSRTHLSSDRLAEVVARLRDWRPDTLIAHGIQTVGVLDQVRQALPHLPWVYRSHNHETVYYGALAKAQPWGVGKVALLWQKIRLSWYEPRLLKRAGAVLHISASEHDFFTKQGLTRQYWVPPVYIYNQPVSPLPEAKWDVGVLSSWFAPQKIEGLRWFFEKVRPALPGSFRIVVAGSGAPAWMRDWCGTHGIEFIGSVDSPSSFYLQCRALVNPVLRGAGVNMKTMEMLASGRPVVSTSAGLAGLPIQVGAYLDVEDDAGRFAEKLLEAVALGERIVPVAAFSPFSGQAVSMQYVSACEVAKSTLLV